MILSFKTKINGKPTYFVEKIHLGLLQNSLLDMVGFDDNDFDGFDINKVAECEPKIHTIRKDDKNRWKPGMMIDFFINARQKDMFRFAPRIPLKSKQRIFMTYLPHLGNGFQVSINGRELHKSEIKVLAVNDGFETVEDFEDYFISEMENDEYNGKIIHWTGFKY